MKTFHCDACEALIFFENTRCLSCGHVLAFVPGRGAMCALEPLEGDRWRPVGGDESQDLRLCRNYVEHDVCNWALDAGDPDALCLSCRLTHTIPDLAVAGNQAAWAKLETAKRRALYSILALQLPLVGKLQDPGGLEFHFKCDEVRPNGDRSRVLTGHDNGVITINVAEADDVYREAQRLQHGEPYRTLLGHFRHEIGHYYWDRLVAGSAALEDFRALFGDEQASYEGALERHYREGPPSDWALRHISAYASMHPWEDWAESWAHVMHMVDALETAHFLGLSARPQRTDEPALTVGPRPPQARVGHVDELLQAWAALTYVLNNLTRGLGLADAYPFVLGEPVLDKIRFVCGCMQRGQTP